MAAGLNEGVITGETICDICYGPLNIGQFTIKTWNEEYHRDSSMVDVLVHSDNIGMVFISRKLGRDKFLEYLKKLKFGSKTNIELQEEVTGKLKEGSDFREMSHRRRLTNCRPYRCRRCHSLRSRNPRLLP